MERRISNTRKFGGGNASINTTDRHGNVLPTIIVSNGQTVNWKSRDYSDNFLSNLTAPTSGKETSINNLCDALVAAGLMGKFRALYPFIGSNAVDNSLNLSYPFLGIAGTDRLTFINSPTHGAGYLEGSGTQHAFAPIQYREIDVQNMSIGMYNLTDAKSAATSVEMGWGGTSGGGIMLSLTTNGSLGGQPFWGINAYGNKLTFNPATVGGLIMGHQSATVRKVTKGTNIEATSALISTAGNVVSYGMGILAGGDGTGIAARRLGAVIVGEFLSVAELASLNTIMQNFMTDKGVSII